MKKKIVNEFRNSLKSFKEATQKNNKSHINSWKQVIDKDHISFYQKYIQF